MKMTTNILSFDDFQIFQEIKVDEILIEVQELSRWGKFSFEEGKSLALSLKKMGIKSFLVWDILMTDDEIQDVLSKIPFDYFTYFDAVRVKDLGAYIYLAESRIENLKAHLMVDEGNHNTQAILSYLNLDFEQGYKILERVILSPEIPHFELKKIIEAIDSKVEIEVYGLGLMPLFYSPRKLLSPYSSSKNIEAIGKSEEGPHKGFIFLENEHGTFMINHRIYTLVSFIDMLKDLKITNFRIERREWFEKKYDVTPFLKEVKRLFEKFSKEDAEDLEKKLPLKKSHGFFLTNRTDQILKRLKNPHLERKEGLYLGEVLEVQKKKHLAIWSQNKEVPIKLGQDVKIYSPDGKIRTLTLSSLRNLAGKEIETLDFDSIGLVPHVGGISLKSKVYLKDDKV